jgi:hypothetical protein
LRKLHELRIALNLDEPADARVLEHLRGNPEIPAADNQHTLHLTVREERNVAHHLVMDEGICGTPPHGAIDHHHSPKVVMVDHELFVSSALHPIAQPLGIEDHSNAGRNLLLEMRLRIHRTLPSALQPHGIMRAGLAAIQ